MLETAIGPVVLSTLGMPNHDVYIHEKKERQPIYTNYRKNQGT
jgi:hypothetical protein